MPEAIRYVCVAQLDGSRRFFFWESGDDAPDLRPGCTTFLLGVHPSLRFSSNCFFSDLRSSERGCVDALAWRDLWPALDNSLARFQTVGIDIVYDEDAVTVHEAADRILSSESGCARVPAQHASASNDRQPWP
jgi:hypothetical protein